MKDRSLNSAFWVWAVGILMLGMLAIRIGIIFWHRL
jgi:hypothetical protein